MSFSFERTRHFKFNFFNRMEKFILVLMCSFTLFGSISAAPKQLQITITNPIGKDRVNEIVEIRKSAIIGKLNLKKGEKLIVTNSKSQQIPYQIAVNLDLQYDSLLIFPVTVKAYGKSIYTIVKGTPEKFSTKVTGRLVPERKDDFNWENDRIAFRMYGPALQATGEISCGIDIWAKRTDKLVADKWYADEEAKKSTYHNDNGEGLDFYKVGPTLGAGAAAPFINDSIWFSKNFTDFQILDKGPLRITFQLNYDWFKIDGQGLARYSRIISLDAGSQLNKIRQKNEFKSKTLPLAAGIVLRNSPDEKTFIDKTKKLYAIHAEPADKENGTLFEAIVGVKPFSTITTKCEHLLCIQSVNPNKFFTYYAGGGWDKFGFKTFDEWTNYIQSFSEKLQHPLLISIK